MPPEGEDVEYEEDITSEVQELAQEAAARLAAKNKDGKVLSRLAEKSCRSRIITSYRFRWYICDEIQTAAPVLRFSKSPTQWRLRPKKKKS